MKVRVRGAAGQRVTLGGLARWVDDSQVVDQRVDLVTWIPTASFALRARRTTGSWGGSRWRRMLGGLTLIALLTACGPSDDAGDAEDQSDTEDPSLEVGEPQERPSEVDESEDASPEDDEPEAPSSESDVAAPAGGCDEFIPAELPSGAPTGEPVERDEREGTLATVWGSGDDRVSVSSGPGMLPVRDENDDVVEGEFFDRVDLDDPGYRTSLSVHMREDIEADDEADVLGETVRYRVSTVGDPPRTAPSILFATSDGCPYSVTISASIGWERDDEGWIPTPARDYATRF